ncbi:MULTISPECIES: NADPH:quinone reductase [Ramlibacter]|uniref:NADPH:quinone reductase n=1 Tax=Ramlibacter aquaticus TaxID=2780094 RepID=A0ABR9SFG8_9BURK|nr:MULTISPECIES: NADPH:quinone reductase [Ramlibacter]MBE7941083.1 NADPH:quinone reductase [Ramlibacter aquaticus]
MRAAWYEKNGPAREVLVVGERPDPEPAPGEVRVRIHVSGVNPSDVKSRARRPLGGPWIIPHSDGAGVVEAVGAGVPASRIGERVWLWNGQWQRPAGTAAEKICLPAAQAVPLPEGASFEEGACVGIPVLTALQALRLAGEVRGRNLLVTGGGSMVGQYVTQLAVRAGARVIATAGAPQRVQLAREAGAEAVIDYRNEPVAERVRELTGGQGADAIIDMDFQSTARLLGEGALRAHGRVLSYGSNDPGQIPVDYRAMLWGSLSIVCFLVYDLQAADREAVTQQATALLRERSLVHPVAARFPLADIAAAHEAVEAGQRVGAVLLQA